MKTKLDGQVAIVTGAARGIGLAIARLLAARGAKVIVWDRDLAPLQKAAGFKPDAAEVVDVASYPSIEAAFNKALKTSASSTSWSTTPASTVPSSRPGNTRWRTGTASSPST